LCLLGYRSGLVTFHSKRELLRLFNVAGSNKPYLGVYVKCLLLLNDFKQIWTCSTNLDLFYKFGLGPQIWTCSTNLDLFYKFGFCLQIWTCSTNLDLVYKFGLGLQIWTWSTDLDLFYKFGLGLQIWTWSTNLDLVYKFSFNSPSSNFMEIRPVRAALLHADGRTVMTKLIGSSCDYANAPRKFITSCIQPAVSVTFANICTAPTFFFFFFL
jgi:hypothetical protein